MTRPANCPENVWAACSKQERDFIIEHERLHAIFASDGPPPLTVDQACQWDAANQARIDAILGAGVLSRVQPKTEALRKKWRHAHVSKGTRKPKWPHKD